MTFRTTTRLSGALLACALLAACGGPSDPGQAIWDRAQSAFNAQDYSLAVDHLEKLEAVEGWRERAAGWRVVLLGGLTHAYLELNEACEVGVDGAGSQRPQTKPVLNALEQYRSDARRYAFKLAEAIRAFDDLTGDVENISLDFDLPSGDADRSPVLARMSGGMMPTGQALVASEQHTLRRGVLLQSARAVGAGDNVATAQKMFEFSPVSIPKSVFLLGVGQTIHEAADLFSVRRLRDHTKQELFFDLAEKCVRPSLDSKNLGLKKEARDIIASINESRSGMEDRDAFKEDNQR